MQSENINELAGALAKAQGAMANAVMNRTNPHFKNAYADLSSVIDAIRVPLAANGLSVVQTMHPTERHLTLRTTLMHSSGQFIASDYPLPATQRAQEMGSALTYARRYSLAAMICNAAEDDDGEVVMTGLPAAKIGEEQLTKVRQLLVQKNIPADRLCKKFKVSALPEITTDMLDDVLSALESKPDAPVEKAA